MTREERIRAAIAGRETDRVPVAAVQFPERPIFWSAVKMPAVSWQKRVNWG